MALHFERVAATHMTDDMLQEVIDVNKAAVEATYSPEFVEQSAVQKAIGADGVDAYRQRMSWPKKPNQLHREPTFTLALDVRDQVRSVAYTAHVVSGDTYLKRIIKMEGPVRARRWAQIGWVATRPDSQRKNLALQVMGHALDGFHPSQPVSAYAWSPSEVGEKALLDLDLLQLGFIALNDDIEADIFTTRYVSASVAQSRQQFGYILRNQKS